MLQAAGGLDERMGGPSGDLDGFGNNRRTVYGRVSRGRASAYLKLYDFPDPTMHSPQRETTTSPLQQLFVLNGEFVQDRAAALALSVAREPDAAAKVRGMYRQLLARDPADRELKLAAEYLKSATPAQFAQALLATNEVIFWP
jgi:hypothetical protein